MQIRQIITTAILLAAASSSASAQMTLPLQNAALSKADSDFLIQEAQGSVADLAHGEAGMERASTNELRQYAIQIVEDHSRLNMRLYQLAQKKGVSLPVIMGDKDRDELQALVFKQGTEFDRLFLQDEVRINTQDVKDADKELSITNDADIRSLVTEYRDTESFMLSRAKAFLAQMNHK